MANDLRARALTALCRKAGRLLTAVPARSSFRQPIRRVLVIKPCCLGDVIQVSPVYASLRAAFPNAQITLMTTAWSAPAAATDPALDEIVPWPIDGAGQPRGILRAVREVRRRTDDLAVVLDRSPVAGFVALLAGIPERAGYDSLGRGFALNRRVPVPSTIHEVDLALSLVDALGLPSPIRLPRYAVPAADQDGAAALLARACVPPGQRVAAIAPGGGTNPGATMPEKRWHQLGFAEIADRLERAGYQPLLVGGETDRPVAAAVRRLATSRPLDFSGATTFGCLGAILATCAVYVGNDSGTSHLAAATGIPTVAIFGPTDPALYAPRGRRVRIVAPPGDRDSGCGTVRDPWFQGSDWHHLVPPDAVWSAITACVTNPC